MKTNSPNTVSRIILNVSKYALLCIIIACGSEGGQTNEDEGFDSLMEEETVAPENKLDEAFLTEIIQRIPSPVELVALLKASGAEYSEAMLNPTENTEKYTTSSKQALNLGIYGADLGYINMYEKTISSLSYLNAVKQMADLIKVGQFFDFNTLKRLSSNTENVDSLLYITTSNFNKMDAYLREQGRSDLSILSVAGAWLEGIYIASQIAKKTNNEEIIERIGEHKMALNDITLILSQYAHDENIAKTAEDFKRIQAAFADVQVNITEAEPEMQEVEGKLVIIDKSSSEIIISKETLANIIIVVNEVRNSCIN